MASTKKYKLFASGGAAGSGERQPCAFFASPQGCRSGESCRFLHVGANSTTNNHPTTGVALDNSTVSSESSDGGVTVEHKNPPATKASTVDHSKHTPMVSVVSTATIADSSPFLTASEAKMAKKNKRNSNSANENPFANPTQAKKQKVAAPAVAASVAAAVATTSPKAPPAAAPQGKAPKSKKSATKPTTNAPTVPVPPPPAAPFSFLSLDLPIASFTMPGTDPTSTGAVATESSTVVTQFDVVKTLPLPVSTPAGRKWVEVVKKTRSHPRYVNSYDLSKYKEQDMSAGYSADSWIKTLPFDVAKAGHPQVIAIDCEMCESQDPVSGRKDNRALCRVSVVDVENDTVLLDSLVKPAWPVTNYRTWVNGITAENLENVQFTLRHAQAFFMALCTEETVIMGHAVHNDLAALRLEHPTVADSACLYAAVDSETAQVALRDLSSHLLQTTMPERHDSVNDARVACQCIEIYRAANGQVDAIPRTPKPTSTKQPHHGSNQLFVHRIPKNVCDATQLSQMFLAHTSIQPMSVDDLIFGDNAGKATIGKTYVTFKSAQHSSLAFDSLDGNADIDPSGRLQKKVYLRNGDYIRVRKMVFETNKNEENQEDASKRRFSK